MTGRARGPGSDSAGRGSDAARASSLPSTPTTSVYHQPRSLSTTVMSDTGGACAVINPNECPTCRKINNKTMGKLIRCDWCKQWAHRGCEGMSPADLQEYDGTTKKYKCVRCLAPRVADSAAILKSMEDMQRIMAEQEESRRKESADRAASWTSFVDEIKQSLAQINTGLSDQIEDLSNRHETLAGQFSDMNSQLTTVAAKVDLLETQSVFSNRNEFEAFFDNKMKPLEDRLTYNEKKMKEWSREVKADVLDIVKRKNKIIIESVPETHKGMEIAELIKEIVDEFNIPDMDSPGIRNSYKWISKANPPSAAKNMISIEFVNELDKARFCDKSVKDKLMSQSTGDKFLGMKIFHDRSPAERKQRQELWKEAEQKNLQLTDSSRIWVVSAVGRVVNVKKRTQQADQ